MKRRIVHLITGLPRVGVELRAVHRDSGCRASSRRHVIALKEEGPMAERIRRLGVLGEFLGMRSALDGGRALARLIRRLREQPPVVVQTWLYHADLIGDGVDLRNPAISKWMDAHGVRGRSFLLGPRDSAALAAGIEELLSMTPESRAALGSAARSDRRQVQCPRCRETLRRSLRRARR